MAACPVAGHIDEQRLAVRVPEAQIECRRVVEPATGRERIVLVVEQSCRRVQRLTHSRPAEAGLEQPLNEHEFDELEERQDARAVELRDVALNRGRICAASPVITECPSPNGGGTFTERGGGRGNVVDAFRLDLRDDARGLAR